MAEDIFIEKRLSRRRVTITAQFQYNFGKWGQFIYPSERTLALMAQPLVTATEVRHLSRIKP